ncbi:unnamed protein product [Phytophthora fragariaefolia]|uniref:Unnamed protein product n=1 Tax=Phytophthora fragariaefolia TaxID=1490495 RepID=A0A9W6XZP4_9STRA|nr:unnamed protein product [Phytophthora fragariaefolia]
MPDHKKGYRLMDINTHAIIYSRDVVFKMDQFPSLAVLTTNPESAHHMQIEQLAKISQPKPATIPTAAPEPATFPIVEPEAGPTISQPTDPQRLSTFREAPDRNEIHYSFRTETTSSSDSPPVCKRPSSQPKTRT